MRQNECSIFSVISKRNIPQYASLPTCFLIEYEVKSLCTNMRFLANH